MTTIVSGGRPRSAKSYPFPTRSNATPTTTPNLVALLRGDGATATYEWIFRSQPILHAVVMKLVYGIARTPLKSYTLGEGDARQRDRSSELAALLRKPHPGGSPFHLKAQAALDLHVHGHALQAKFRRRGPGSTVVELWPVPWRHVDPIRDDHQQILGYSIIAGGQRVTVGPEQVLHYELPGGSPIESLRSTLALEDASQTYQAGSIKNGISPRTAFTTEQRLADNVIPRLKAEIGDFYSGVDNAGHAMVLDMGLKPERMGTTPVDLDLIAQRKLSREEVLTAYDVAPILFGLETGSYGAMAEYRRGLYDAIASKLVLIEETMQAQLVDPEPAWDGLFGEFDTNEWMRPDPEARARMHMLNQQSSTNTVNERRAAENLPPIDDPLADTVLFPANMLPAGSDAGTPMQGVADVVLDPGLDTASLLAESFRAGLRPHPVTPQEG